MTRPSQPSLKQVIQQVNAHVGLVFAPDGNTLYAAGGNDDAVYVYTRNGDSFAPAPPIALGHYPPGSTGSARNRGVGINVQPNASGMDVSADGRTLVVANNYNDSISVIDTETRTVRYEHDLRPYFANNEGQQGGVGGTFPFGVVIKGDETAYVSSDRDRQVVVVDVSSPTEGHLIRRIRLDGNALGMTLDESQTTLYVAQDNADQVAVINTQTNQLVAKIDARAPAGLLPSGRRYTGAATSAVTISPDGGTLYAVNSGSNSIAVIPLKGSKPSVSGLIPTAFEPHDITFSPDGSWMYIINGKSVTGPNPGHLASSTAQITHFQYPGGNAAAAVASRASNQYQFQLERASLVSAPVPGRHDLDKLTEQVARNNFYKTETSQRDERVVRFLNERIKHVIYVVKENRTFDQVLGRPDQRRQGRPEPAPVRPSPHAELSQARHRIRDARQLHEPRRRQHGRLVMDAAGARDQDGDDHAADQLRRGEPRSSYESEGSNRDAPVNWTTVAQRDAAAGPAGTTNYSD